MLGGVMYIQLPINVTKSLPSPTHHQQGSRPQTTPVLVKLQELCECEGTLQEKQGELREVASQLEQVQKLAAR